MPIDPNIALGVRPIEQPNMMGQMGQMMQMRQLQQEYESQNALRDFYARGGDVSNPEQRRQLMAQAPMLGQKILGQQSEMQARDVKTQADSLKSIKENVGVVNNPQDMATYLKGAYSTPGGVLLSQMVPLEKALAAIPSDPKAFEEYKRNFGLTADKLFVDANTIANNQARIQAANISAAPGHRQATIAGQRLEMDRAGTYNVVPGETIDAEGNRVPTFAVVNSRTGNINVPGANAPALSMPPQPRATPPVTTAAPSVANNLGGAQTPPANVNALTQPLTAAPSPVSLTTPPATPVQFGPKPTPAQEKQAETFKIKEESKKNIDATLDDFFNKYSELVKKGAITDTRATTLDNLSAALASSEAGQAYGRATGDPAQAIRDSINQKKPLLVQAIAKATGMSSQQLNSNQELQTYLRAMTDPKITIQSNIDAMNGLSRQFGLGKEFTLPEAGPAPKSSTGKSATSSNIVEVDGKAFTFPTPEAAAEFRKKVGK